MIPPPKLDDRSFNDIVEEAISMIPRYSPEWTNHNPSDPGITLIELAAWMTDLLIYRLNQVPDKNYVAFLNLLGIKLRAPRAAKAHLRFSLVEGASKQRIPRGTQVSTPQATEEHTVTFETARDLVVSAAKPDRCFSYFDNSYSENSRFIDLPVGTDAGAFEVYGGAQRIDRYLYLSDPRFANTGDSALLRIYLGTPERGARDLARLLEWEYWEGTRWTELTPTQIEIDRGEIAFLGPLRFEATTVNHVEGLWMRGRLAEVPDDPADTEIDTIRARVEVVGEGLLPTQAYANLDSNAFLALDLGKNIYPFGKEPKSDNILYLACDELLQTADAYITIEMLLADSSTVPRPNPSDQLVIAWEYYDGKRWRHLGRTAPRGALPGAGDELGFHDDTKAFSQSGTVSFRRPRDMESVEINGVGNRWVRARIEKGDFGEQGQYTLESDKWIFKDDRPLRAPALRSMTFRYREDYRDARHVLAFNDFQFTDVTEVARTEFTIFQPFQARPEESPALYLGFAGKPANDPLGLYFQLDEELGLGSLPSDEAEVATTELDKYETMRRLAWETGQRVVWEYWDGREWEPLAVDDETQGFTASGYVLLIAPENWAQSSKFTEERFWLRARLEQGGYVKPPRVRMILTNSIDAYNQETMRSETLGTSDGTPLQHFKILRQPLLDDEVIEVRERNKPAAEEIVDLGVEATRPVDPDNSQNNEVWVRWKRVDSFFASTARSRHYTLDYVTGEVTFGDGRRGMVPPEGRNNIVASSYRIGGGSLGNVNPNTLTSLGRALAYVDTVTNPLAATGGADRETIDEAKSRCVPDRSNRGHVTLVLLPKGELRGEEIKRRLVPSNEVLRFVKRYLDDRKLVGTVLNVVKPRYKDLSLRVVLIRRTVGTSDRLRRDIETKLRRYLHSLVGGRDGKGWEFGRPVLKAELIHLAEEVPGVEGVDALEIRDELRNVGVEHLRLDDDELPFLVHVHVAEKVRDDIR